MKLDKRLVALINSKAGSGGGVSEETVTTMITAAINSLIDSAPEEYDTLGKVAAKLLLTDEQIQTIMTQVADRYTKEETNELVSKIPKFAIEVVAELPTENISTTTVYLKTGSKSDPDNIYDEYIYIKSKWELLGSQTIDLSGYVTTDALTTALKNIDDELSNKLDKSGGALTGELTTQDININGTVSQNNVYSREILGALDVGASYKNLDSKYKDGTYHRMWRIRFNSSIKFVGKIKVNLKSSWSTFNAMGTMSKTINCGYEFSNIYNNVGYYDSLGYWTEQEFRISELVMNATARAWEILIWQNHLAGDNSPVITLEFFGDVAPIVTAQSVELTQMTSYTAPKASPTGGDKVVNWADTPVFETPYGKEVATTDIATMSSNGLMSKDDKKKLDGMDSTADEIATIVNEYGSKNLVDTSLIPNSTGGGVTRKNNGDGSITYSGTSTLSNDTFIPLMASQPLNPGTYIFSVNAITSTSYSYQLYKNKAYWKNINITEPIEITESAIYAIGIVLGSKASISNTFKPMLRYAAIKDDTYVPYAMTNRELTKKVVDTGWVEVDLSNTEFENTWCDITKSTLIYRRFGNMVSFYGYFYRLESAPETTVLSLTFKDLPGDILVPVWAAGKAGAEVAREDVINTNYGEILCDLVVYTNGNVTISFRSKTDKNISGHTDIAMNVVLTYMV